MDAALTPLHEKLAALRAEVLGEQPGLVSVLFADRAGFTALATDMDLEEVSEVMNEHSRVCVPEPPQTRWAG